ncbi:MAG: radical SAM protein [Thermoguttaceae bacterium]|jgi:wyosine [tRNA(Phe)-imidazoG37] synthetase (radical SAM superfamily)
MTIPTPASALYQSHPRSFADYRFVYPVLSRRSRGISVGVNLNPEQSCNFSCVYCQVERQKGTVGICRNDPQGASREKSASQESGRSPFSRSDLAALAGELDEMVELVVSGRLFQSAPFLDTPEPLRRFNDIAVSGDGEPTAVALLPEVVELCAEVRRRHRLDDVKLVLITNGSLLHRQEVRRALAVLDANNGEVWAKLDAGSEAYYKQVNRSHVPLGQILDNLRQTARARPIVIQSLFVRLEGQPPPPAEQAAYCERLGEIIAAGGQIKLVQIHSMARPGAENRAAPLADDELQALAERVRRSTGLPVTAYPG